MKVNSEVSSPKVVRSGLFLVLTLLSLTLGSSSAVANVVSIYGTPAGDIILMGYDGATGNYWHQLAGLPAVNDGPGVSSYRVLSYGGNDRISARGILPEAPSPLDIELYAKGGTGNDVIIGGDGWDKLYGESGNDSLAGWDGRDRIEGGAGDDKIYGMVDRDYLYGGDGKDKIYGGRHRDEIRGQDNKDELYGDDGADLIWGGKGDDYISGDKGLDYLKGEPGDDRVFGGPHPDKVEGGSGTDYVYGNGAVDPWVKGDADAADQCAGGPGADPLVDGGSHLFDRCSECRPGGTDNCLPTCEIQRAAAIAVIASIDPVQAFYDPVDSLLDLEADFIDLLTDGEHLVQKLNGRESCHDPLLGMPLIMGDAFLEGSDPDGRYLFTDISLAIEDEVGDPLLMATVVNVSLDSLTGIFGGPLEDVIINNSIGSRMLSLMQLALDEGDTVDCWVMSPGGAVGLLSATDYFTEPGFSEGAYQMIFDLSEDIAGLEFEICDNGVDDNGDGCVDCEDSDCAEYHLCFEQACSNGIDDDGDGLTDCDDEDCFDDSTCLEDCTNGIDDNGNGLVDCEDPVCSLEETCIEVFNCDDGLDNDCDGLVDCEDPACGSDPACPAAEGCCVAETTCYDLTPAECLAQGGVPLGPGTFCLGDMDGDDIDDACTLAGIVGDTPSPDALPPSQRLRVTGPNPFRKDQGLRFAYHVPEDGIHVSIAVYDPRGRRVALLVEGRVEPGTYERTWFGPDLNRLSAGVYFLHLETGKFRATRRITLLK